MAQSRQQDTQLGSRVISMSNKTIFGLPRHLILTLAISLYSIILAVFFPSISRTLIAIAMLISSLGDIVLMDFKPIVRYLPFKGFVAGAIVFMISHLFYIAAFGYSIYINEYTYFNIGVIIAILLFVAVVISMTLISLIRHSQGIKLLLPGILYVAIICANCSNICSYYFSHRGIAICSMVGIISFLISDYFIVLRSVCGIKSKVLQKLIWIFYPIGQILLITGA